MKDDLNKLLTVVDTRKPIKKVLDWFKYKFLKLIHVLCNQVYVGFTPAFQSYFSAGDEAEPYCLRCECYLDDEDKFCKKCGAELIWPH